MCKGELEMKLDYILNTEKSVRFEPYKAIKCKDGTSLSVQVGEGLYCSPRNNYGPWHLVEVGYPTETPPNSWVEYWEGEWYSNKIARFFNGYWKHLLWQCHPSKGLKYYKTNKEKLGGAIRHIIRAWQMGVVSPLGCDNIYPYIPVELVREYIELHGGEK